MWSKGATAAGSSGSPLIDVGSGKVVGVLTGGFASCDDPMAPDYYGRLSAVRRVGRPSLPCVAEQAVPLHQLFAAARSSTLMSLARQSPYLAMCDITMIWFNATTWNST